MFDRLQHDRKPMVVAILLVAVLCSFVTHVTTDSPLHVAWDILPDIGSLDILPSGPSAWLAVTELATDESDPLLVAVSPRGPPS